MMKIPMLDQSVALPESAENHSNRKQPIAIGLVRPDLYGTGTARHAVEIQRHALRLGYRYAGTVRPPAQHSDPIGYGLASALEFDAVAVVVHDLTTVDHSPARVCDWCDLETVCPPETWARSGIAPEHARPCYPITVLEAQRIMQWHRACSAHHCPRKAAALGCLVRAGRMVAPVRTPRERAAARGIRFEPIGVEPPLAAGPDIGTLLGVLDGLVADTRPGQRYAAAVDDTPKRTEVDGLEAVWTLESRQRIEIHRAHDTTTGEVIEFGPGTDLADARERTSWRWATLWDRIAHQMWTEWVSGQRSSVAAPTTRSIG